jgi:hypothetical protein
MKKFLVPAAAMLMIAFTSCFHHHNDMSVTISENDEAFEMDAAYRKSKTHDVEVYLNDHLLNGAVTIRNKRGEEIILDDDTKFNLRSRPGRLHISIDKSENPEASCEKIRIVCEDLQDILEDN